MNLMKYLIAGGVSLVIGIAAMIMGGNIFTAVLVFVSLFGGYILWNISKNLTPDTPQNPPQNPPSDN